MKELLISELTDNPSINLALDTIKINKQAIIFANTKRSAEKLAEDLSYEIKQTTPELEELAKKSEKALSTATKQCKRLAFCLRKGIAFHHAGLAYAQKQLIEENFRKGIIKIICATPTLALGVSMPAFRVILNDLKRFSHRGLVWIPTLEYLQQAGRAGRPEWDKYGEAIAVAKTNSAAREIAERYIKGEPEEIYSKLAVEPVLRTYLLSLIASGFVRDKKEIMEFFSKTFWAFQFKDMNQLEVNIMKMLKLLQDYEFITSTESNDDFKSASEISNIQYKPTLIGKRVAELYIDPYTANYLINCAKTAAKKKINEFSFLQSISHTLEIRPLLRVKVKEYDLVQQEVMIESEYLLETEPQIYESEYDDFMASVKTAMFLKDWINEKDEEYLLEKFDIRPGEIRAKLDLSDWLLYATTELVRLLGLKEIIKELLKLRFRIKNGAKEELIPLLKLKGIGRVRARKMFNAGIKDIGDVKKAKKEDLSRILGPSVAISVKEQVGQKDWKKDASLIEEAELVKSTKEDE